MTASRRIDHLLASASERLAAASDSARLDAELLLARAIDMPRSFLFAHGEDELDADALERFETSLLRRLDGEPLAYICGEKEFWSMMLMVGPATLVPRPETELLVEQALAHLPRRAALRIADLGTGSGAIALAIARERPQCQVTATDRSEDALAVARCNARHLDLPNIEFLQGDWTAPLAGRQFEIIVSNPPYLASADPALAALRHEPGDALVAGSDGLDALRQLARDCRDIVAADGVLLLEHGATQEVAVAELLRAAGWQDPRCHRDYAGLPRVTEARAGPVAGTDWPVATSDR